MNKASVSKIFALIMGVGVFGMGQGRADTSYIGFNFSDRVEAAIGSSYNGLTQSFRNVAAGLDMRITTSVFGSAVMTSLGSRGAPSSWPASRVGSRRCWPRWQGGPLHGPSCRNEPTTWAESSPGKHSPRSLAQHGPLSVSDACVERGSSMCSPPTRAAVSGRVRRRRPSASGRLHPGAVAHGRAAALAPRRRRSRSCPCVRGSSAGLPVRGAPRWHDESRHGRRSARSSLRTGRCVVLV